MRLHIPCLGKDQFQNPYGRLPVRSKNRSVEVLCYPVVMGVERPAEALATLDRFLERVGHDGSVFIAD